MVMENTRFGEVYIRAYGEARFELCTLSTHMLEGGATLIMYRRKGRFPNIQSIPQLIISLVIDNSRSNKMPLDFDSGSLGRELAIYNSCSRVNQPVGARGTYGSVGIVKQVSRLCQMLKAVELMR